MSKRKRELASKSANVEEAAAAAAAAAASAPEEPAEEADWKETVFFWRGLLQLSDGGQQQKLKWNGTWVAGTAAAGLPGASEFAASATTFALTGVLPPQMPGIRLSANGDRLSPSAMTARFKGAYLLDNGDGPRPYTDHAHSFQMFRASAETVHVVAKGTTEFGPFISAGRLDHVPDDTTGNVVTLTLARRYLEDRDKRVRWGMVQLAESLVAVDGDEAGFTSAEIAEQPWRARSMQLRFKSRKKNSKEGTIKKQKKSSKKKKKKKTKNEG
jgi:hypothetical protein